MSIFWVDPPDPAPAPTRQPPRWFDLLLVSAAIGVIAAWVLAGLWS